MKLLRAIIRPEREDAVLQKLEEVGLFAVTKMGVLGRGQQRGIHVGKIKYDTLSKIMLLLVVEDEEYDKATAAIAAGGLTGYPGDGKIFVHDVSEVYTIRTGMMHSGASD